MGRLWRRQIIRDAREINIWELEVVLVVLEITNAQTSPMGRGRLGKRQILEEVVIFLLYTNRELVATDMIGMKSDVPRPD